MANKVCYTCNHMTLVFCMLDNFFMSASSLFHCFAEDVIDVFTSPSCISKYKTITISISICYAKYHNVNDFAPQKICYLTNRVMLIISGHGTSRPLGILCRPFANNACDTKYHRLCSGHFFMTLCFKYNKHMSLVQLSCIIEKLSCVELDGLQIYCYGGFFILFA